MGKRQASNPASQQTSRTVPVALAYDQQIAHEDTVLGVGDSFSIEFVIEFVHVFGDAIFTPAQHRAMIHFRSSPTYSVHVYA